jgi:preprotein translocase subunit SecA
MRHFDASSRGRRSLHRGEIRNAQRLAKVKTLKIPLATHLNAIEGKWRPVTVNDYFCPPRCSRMDGASRIPGWA